MRAVSIQHSCVLAQTAVPEAGAVGMPLSAGSNTQVGCCISHAQNLTLQVSSTCCGLPAPALCTGHLCDGRQASERARPGGCSPCPAPPSGGGAVPDAERRIAGTDAGVCTAAVFCMLVGLVVMCKHARLHSCFRIAHQQCISLSLIEDSHTSIAPSLVLLLHLNISIVVGGAGVLICGCAPCWRPQQRRGGGCTR